MSKFGAAVLKAVNRFVKKPVHPFNLQNDGEKTYAMWQYERGEDTIKFFLDFADKKEMFSGKKILDVGCGAGGKSLYYAGLGADVTGLEIVASYESEAKELCGKLGFEYGKNFRFVCADAENMPFDDESFDTVIMNDAVEHISKPEKVFSEVLRVLKKGGKLYANFPPYYHPYGAHLSDAIGLPWVHCFFSEDSLIRAYKDLVKDLPDGENRINFRISKRQDGTEYFSYINKMTLKRFKNIMKNMNITPFYYKEIPLRSFLSPLAKFKPTKELFVKMAVFSIEKIG